MNGGEIFVEPVFNIGPLTITSTVITTWAIITILGILGWLMTRHMHEVPGIIQVISEGVVGVMENAVQMVLPQHYRVVAPFIMTLWIFIVVANLAQTTMLPLH